ncbi:hypothetical protein OSK38_30020, partial [Escherichia coli]|nr:hypothetical protein [Escherichia coli]
FKDKRYWILLVPFLIILVCFVVFASTSDFFLEHTSIFPLFTILYVSLFWITYHLWKYFGDEKKKNNIN